VSWKSEIELIAQQSLAVVYRPDEVYLNGANVLFNIVGGPVWIHALFAVLAADLDFAVAGATANFTINGIAVDAGPVAVAGGALGQMMVCPLDDTGAGPVVVNLPAVSNPSPAGRWRVIATNVPGDITLVVGGGVDFDGACAFYCLYQKVAPQSLVVVA
jgi:hypothetical protein